MDQKLLFLINREWINPTLDRVMTIASSFDVWLLPLLVLLVCVGWLGGFTARAFLITAALVVAVNDGLVSNTLKKLVDRPRPFQSHNDVRQLDLAKARPRILALGAPLKIKLSRANLDDVDGRSFPSSHTINNFSIATICAAFYRRWGWLAFFPAAVVGYSRIYTGAHWPSDVLTTIPLAIGSTLLLLALSEWLWQRIGGRCLPRVAAEHPSLFHREASLNRSAAV